MQKGDPPPMAKVSKLTRVVSFTLLAASVAMVYAGMQREYDVRLENADEIAGLLGFAPFETISEVQLVIDATFTGVARRDGSLYSTYDRSQPQGKRSCPT
jgi:hypothetical protein